MKPITEHPIPIGSFETIANCKARHNMSDALVSSIERLNLRIRSLETKCAELDRRTLENEVRTNLCRNEVKEARR